MARSKYKAVPTVVDGVRFASKAEAKRDAELVLLEKAGDIRNLRRQPRFPLVVGDKKICTYVGDWQYEEIDVRKTPGCRPWGAWVSVVEDKKGFRTKEWVLKFKLAKALHPEIDWRTS